jgi:hypothetical protein
MRILKGDWIDWNIAGANVKIARDTSGVKSCIPGLWFLQQR